MANVAGSNPISVRAVCFDVGDTLVFDKPSRKQRVAEALESCGYSITPDEFGDIYETVEKRGVELYLQGIMPDEPESAIELIGLILTSLKVPQSQAIRLKILQSYTSIASERYVASGAEPLLKTLKSRGFRMGVISDWEPDLQVLLGNLSIAKYFDSFSVSSLVGATKPSRKLFDDALVKLSIEPSECLHIGDYCELDVAGSHSAGMHSLLFDSQNRYTGRYIPCAVVRTFDELTAYLDSVNLSQ